MSEGARQFLSLIWLVLIVLLPVLPAWILFKYLPSTAVVKGPLKGLDINVGGAYAAYFILVVLLLYTRERFVTPALYQVWAVHGTVTDETDDVPLELFKEQDISLIPPELNVYEHGSFSLHFYSSPPPGGQGFEYPELNIGHKNFGNIKILLDPAELKSQKNQRWSANIDESSRQIHLKIRLHKLPPPPWSGP